MSVACLQHRCLFILHAPAQVAPQLQRTQAPESKHKNWHCTTTAHPSTAIHQLRTTTTSCSN